MLEMWPLPKYFGYIPAVQGSRWGTEKAKERKREREVQRKKERMKERERKRERKKCFCTSEKKNLAGGL